MNKLVWEKSYGNIQGFVCGLYMGGSNLCSYMQLTPVNSGSVQAFCECVKRLLDLSWVTAIMFVKDSLNFLDYYIKCCSYVYI